MIDDVRDRRERVLLRTIDDLPEERLRQLADYAEVLKRDEYMGIQTSYRRLTQQSE